MSERVVVITGATGATGRAAARAFSAQGALLALISHDPARLNALSADLNLPAARFVTCTADLRRIEEAEAAARFVHTRFGRADILLHLVGGWTGGTPFSETPSADLQTMLEQHAWTTFHITRAFTPGMVRNGWGRVIVVSSPLAVAPVARMSAYSMGKAAQEALILALAQELRDTGVTANILQVRAIDVEGAGRGTSPEELTAAMLYLCSEQAARVNGARIPLF
ncbi:MAG: SDR family oxidoreductase [Anaerolineales bacterium]|nr:SDR family oxidoreductase [Anaerolineales bacterium]MCX7755818.1 SDR family oxidoreductase [Anaerolineales bacterium]MDW8279290.1 SDR family oxidoreductase [Anaerolineales bacterium]